MNGHTEKNRGFRSAEIRTTARELAAKETREFSQFINDLIKNLEKEAEDNPTLLSFVKEFNANFPEEITKEFSDGNKEELMHYVELFAQEMEVIENRQMDTEGRHERTSDEILLQKLENGEELDENEVRAARNMTERRDWGKIYGHLEAGDRVVNFLIPADSYLALKHLNDDLFGPTETDQMLQKGRIILKESFFRHVPKASDESVLSQDYKNSIFRIRLTAEQKEEIEKNNIDPREYIQKMVDKVMEEANEKMRIFLLLRGIRERRALDLKQTTTADDEKRKKALEEFISHFDKRASGAVDGYRLNCGIAEVKNKAGEGKANPEEVALALAESSLGTRLVEIKRLVEELKTKYCKDSEGECELNKFDIASKGQESSEMAGALIIFQELAREVRDLKEIVTEDGDVYPVADEQGNFNTELLGNIRKGKIHVSPDNQIKLDKLYLYYRMMNMPDFVKPHTAEEIRGEKKVQTAEGEATLAEYLGKKKDLADGLSKEMSDEDRKVMEKQMHEILKRSEKNENYTSDAEFEAEALKIDNCTIISVDLLGVGVKQLSNYEKALRSIDTKNKSKDEIEKAMKQAALLASDALTEDLRNFRNTIAEIVRKKIGPDAADKLVVGKVGGDELVLALDSSMVDNELLFKIKNALEGTDSRIVTSKADRSKHGNRKEAHKEAMKSADAGINKAKDIEEMVKKINRRMERTDKEAAFSSGPQSDFLRRLLVWDNEKKYLLPNCTILTEPGDKFVVQFKDGTKMSYEEVEAGLAAVAPKTSKDKKKIAA